MLVCGFGLLLCCRNETKKSDFDQKDISQMILDSETKRETIERQCRIRRKELEWVVQDPI